MSNTLTPFIPTLFQAADIVSRELTGFIPAVTRNSSAERAAKDETINFPIAPAATLYDVTPGLYAPDNGDQTAGSGSITISKSKYAPVRWNGEEMKGVNNSGVLPTFMRDQFAQAMRALVNAVEVDLAALYYKASRAYGTGGTAPFGTAADLSDFAGVLAILDDNGCPVSDRHLVLGTTAIANLRGKQSVLFKVNEAGTSDLLRLGIIGMVEGLMLHNSAQVAAATKGTGTSYIVNGSFAAGATTIGIDTGSGTVVAGDVVLVGSTDTNKYVVNTGVTAAGSIIINAPGLRKALADNATGFTIGTSYAANMAFHRSAIHLVTRSPAMPDGGDTADDVTEIQDPVSGLAFQVALYRQYRQIKFEIGLAWGCAAVKPEHIALLIG